LQENSKQLALKNLLTIINLWLEDVLAGFNKMEWTEKPTQKYLFTIEYLTGLNTSGEPSLHDP